MANESLVTLLVGKVDGNNQTISFINTKKPETQKTIDLFTSPTTVLDTQIVSIASSINTLKTDIVTLATNAYSVGCGTTSTYAATYFPDVVRTYVANISTSTYNGSDPYGNTSSSLSSNNLGIGTLLVYSQNDTSQSGIGSVATNINTCYRAKSLIPLIACVSGECVSYAASITDKQNQLTTLTAQLQALVSNSNNLRNERLDYELERYSQNQSVLYLTNRNIGINTAINVLKY
jgi:hypothetical protein